MNGSTKTFLRKYLLEHPESAALIIMRSDSVSIAQLVRDFKSESLVNAFNRIPAHILSDSLINVKDKLIADLLSKVEPTLAARILRRWLLDKNLTKFNAVIDLFEKKKAGEIRKLVDYPEDVVGALMNPTPFTVSPDLTVGAALEILKQQKNRYSRYSYVVNAEKELVGVISFKDMYYSDSNLLVSEVMSSKTYSLNVNAGIQHALKDDSWAKWGSLPIVNSKNKLQGVLKYEIMSSHAAKSNIATKDNDEIIKAGNAVGEVLQIGMNATISLLGGHKGHLNENS